MKQNSPIQIRAGDLKPAITGLSKVLPGNSPVQALRCVKIESISHDSIRLTATNLDLTLDLTIPAKFEAKPAPFLLPLNQLRDQARNAKVNDIIDITPSTDAPSASEFPVLPAFRATPIPLTKDITTSLLRAMACSSHDETRHLLRGAFIDVTGSGKNAHRIIATDGRHLFSSNSMHLPQIKSPVILPDHKLWQWRLIAESRPWTLRISPLKNGGVLFRINGPNWSVTGKTIEGTYPNYRQVVPQPEEFKTHVQFSNAALETMIELIPTFPGKKLNNRPVGIWTQRGTVSLLARETNDEPWKGYPVGKCDVKGPDVKVLVNRDYLLKCARFGLSELAVIDEMSPLRFTRGSDLMIVMPIRATGSDQVAGVKHRAPQPDPKLPTQPQSKVPFRSDPVPAAPDPIKVAEAQITQAKQALEAAGGSLQTVRQQRENDQKELSGFRSLFNSIKRFATGRK